MNWEPEAANWMYSQNLEFDKDEHYVVTSCLLFGLQRLGVHVRQKPSWYADELEYNIPVEID